MIITPKGFRHIIEEVSRKLTVYKAFPREEEYRFTDLAVYRSWILDHIEEIYGCDIMREV